MKLALAVFVIAVSCRADPSVPLVPDYLRGIGIDQNLNAQVPLGIFFADEFGRLVKLGDLLGKRPAILALVYYTCPALCDQILHGVVRGLKPLSFKAGGDFDVIAISINPNEKPPDAAEKRQEVVKLYSSTASPAGWHFLTGTEPNIRAVADAAGFRYRYDPKTKMYFHAAGVMVLTPEGKLSRYLYGVEYEPKDLKLALVEASQNRIGTVVERILLFCYHYDPLKGKYSATILNLLHVAAVVFLVILIAGFTLLWRRELHRKHAEQHL
jgi:protein SCO1/2